MNCSYCTEQFEGTNWMLFKDNVFCSAMCVQKMEESKFIKTILLETARSRERLGNSLDRRRDRREVVP